MDDEQQQRPQPHSLGLEERLRCGGRVDMREVAGLACVSLSKVYGDIRAGRLQTIVHGRQRFTTPAHVRRYLEGD